MNLIYFAGSCKNAPGNDIHHSFHHFLRYASGFKIHRSENRKKIRNLYCRRSLFRRSHIDPFPDRLNQCRSERMVSPRNGRHSCSSRDQYILLLWRRIRTSGLHQLRLLLREAHRTLVRILERRFFQSLFCFSGRDEKNFLRTQLGGNPSHADTSDNRNDKCACRLNRPYPIHTRILSLRFHGFSYHRPGLEGIVGVFQGRLQRGRRMVLLSNHQRSQHTPRLFFNSPVFRARCSGDHAHGWPGFPLEAGMGSVLSIPVADRIFNIRQKPCHRIGAEILRPSRANLEKTVQRKNKNTLPTSSLE